MHRHLSLAALFCALLALAACKPADPYFEGVGPEVDEVVPAWENGNLGGEHILGLVADIDNPDEDEQALVEDYVVTVQGSFPEGECDDPAVQFGSRAVTILAVRTDAIQVLVPPGPVRGGKVDIVVTCANGATVLPGGYDYVLGDVDDADHYEDDVLVDEDGEAIRRMAPIYENEYASFTLFYGAAPFLNQPEPVGYGFFFNQPAPRAANFYGQTSGLVYAGEAANVLATRAVPPQVPQVGYVAPEQGDRIRGGPDVWYFRRRNTSDYNEPLTSFARKTPVSNPLVPDPYQPEPDGSQAAPFNRHAVWMGVPFDDDEGIPRVRFVRIGNDTGRWCAPLNPDDPLGEGCTGDAGDDDFLNDTRLPLSFGFRWFEPEEPSIESLRDEYPHAAPELLEYAECTEAGGEEVDCLASGGGLDLPSGTYDNVFLCRALDEFDEFPWYRGGDPDSEFDDGMCLIMETLGEIELTQGATWIDIDQVAKGRWSLNEDGNYYDGFTTRYSGVGENVMLRGEPIFIGYEQGFYRGDLVPAKNPGLEIPSDVPYPMGYACRNVDGDVDPRLECDDDETVVARFDDFPFIEVPPMEVGTFADAVTQGIMSQDDDRTFLGLATALDPVLLPMPDEDALNWRIPLPGGVDGADPMDGDGWDDTYFVITLELRDLDRPGGLDNDAAWRASAFAWPGDDYVTIPAETLATLPEVADVFRPDSEDQRGSQYIGIIRMQAHRTAAWNLNNPALGEAGLFRDTEGRAIFDVNTEWLWYFQNQHSCFDSLDNDGDGLCDVLGCDDEDGNRLEPDPACVKLDPDDDQELYETATCQNDEDDDEDGLVDMDDPDCDDPNDTIEAPSCSDDVDNDEDGWTDFPDDPGCSNAQASDEGQYSYATDCNDSIDNDGDGRIDAMDPSCFDALQSEGNDTCNDGLDNNEDGWTDQDDLTCRPDAFYPEGEATYTPTASDEFECSSMERTMQPDGTFLDVPIDEDDDGVANADDPDCLWGWDPSGESATPDVCHDRIDNDGDGWVDDLDAQCSLNPDSEEEGLASGTCADGEDNDGDGWIDELDPACLSGADTEVGVLSPLQCNNQVDDDEDGDVDADDVDCHSGKDNHEEP